MNSSSSPRTNEWDEPQVLPDGLESAYIGEGILCLVCEEGALQPGESCDKCGATPEQNGLTSR